MVHQCVINSVMWLHILVGPCWCVCCINALTEDGVTAPKHVGAILM